MVRKLSHGSTPQDVGKTAPERMQHHTQTQPQPNEKTLDAAVSLLGDPEATVFQRCREHILLHGEAARSILERASETGDVRLRLRARGVLKSLDLRLWVDRVGQRCRRQTGRQSGRQAGRLAAVGASAGPQLDPLSDNLDPPQHPDQARELLHAAMLLSAAGRECSPSVEDVERWLSRVAAELRPRLVGRTASTGARILGDVMRRELGFDGNHGSYYERDNVFLDRVVAQRRGIPVALSILYLVVGRWAGLSMAGVGMPDHFLVRIHGVRPILVDPFHGARAVTKTDCLRYLRTAGYENSAADYLRDLPDRDVLAHLVRNLLRVHDYLGDAEACAAFHEALRHLDEGA